MKKNTNATGEFTPPTSPPLCSPNNNNNNNNNNEESDSELNSNDEASLNSSSTNFTNLTNLSTNPLSSISISQYGDAKHKPRSNIKNLLWLPEFGIQKSMYFECLNKFENDIEELVTKNSSCFSAELCEYSITNATVIQMVKF